MLTTLQRMANTQPTAIAIEENGIGLSYTSLWESVQEVAAMLMLQRPRVVAIDLPNDSQWVITHLACLLATIPHVPLPPFFTAQQREHALRDAGVDLVVGATAIAVLDHPAVVLPHGTAIVTYTSGSTGAPKGVCLSQQGLKQVATSLIVVLGPGLAQRHLCVLPLAVLLEQVAGLYPTLLSGGTYVITDGLAGADGLYDGLMASRAISCILVPELLKHLVLSCERHGGDFPHLRFVAVGGARVADGLLQAAHICGLPVYQGYGLSEAASVVAVNTPDAARAGTVGRLLPHSACRIAADGEIMLRQPAILGYAGGASWQGEYATGDLGQLDDDGFLTIRGRKKNLLITGLGRNISPEWPESMLTAQSEIAQAVVYGDGAASLSALIVPASAVPEAAIAAAVARVNASLPDYARIGAWRLCAPFTQANGLLTGTGRVRRAAILQSQLNKEELHHEFL